MSTTARVGGFVLGLAAVAGGATALGAYVGPVDTETVNHSGAHRSPPKQGSSAPRGLPGGLMVSQDGYSLRVLDDRIDTPGMKVLQFRVTDGAGLPITAYEETHGKDVHLIAVRRDLTDFQHVHPVLGVGGTWSVPLDLSAPGEYRVFADFQPAGADSGYTLGHDVSVAGRYAPKPLPATSREASVDGYDVRLEGDLVAGETSRLTLNVTRDGTPVTDLQPYLGASGHLVALRDHDLAYLHVHPEGEPGAGPTITFDAEVPSTGDFRLFLDFRHDGQVHTAAFTLPGVPARSAVSVPTATPTSDETSEDAAHH